VSPGGWHSPQGVDFAAQHPTKTDHRPKKRSKANEKKFKREEKYFVLMGMSRRERIGRRKLAR
jgi:hypothetical protein